MTTPSSGSISMGDVNTETSWTQTMFNYFNFANFGGNGTLQYHNLDMGPSNNQTAKEAVYDKVSLGASGQNLNLSSWYNYNQNPNGIFDITFTNAGATCTVQVDLYLADPYNSPITYLPMYGPDNGPNGANTRFTLNPSNGSDFSQQNVDSGVVMSSTNFPSGVYVVYADLTAEEPPPPPPPPPPTPTQGSGTASDTDTVGAGTTRTVPTVIGPFSPGSALTKTPIVRGNIPGGTGDGIYVNKRTTWNINFT